MSQAGGVEQGALSETDRLRLDYQQTTDLLRSLTDIRFRLLALVPALSGAAVAFVGHPASPTQLVALGALGLTATGGILLYELRNSQLSDYAARRAQQLEQALALVSFAGNRVGGLFSERPPRTLRLLGGIAVDRDRGLALVYSAALAGWSYLLAWGILRATHVGSARPIGAGIAFALALLLLADLARLRERPRPEPVGRTQEPLAAQR
jgi:hypothetical protein